MPSVDLTKELRPFRKGEIAPNGTTIAESATFYAQPFGPFNRFLDSTSSLYLESGAVQLSPTLWTNPKSYLPEVLYTNKDWCPVIGFLKVSYTVTENKGECPTLVPSRVTGGNGVKDKGGKKGTTKSVAIGCETPKRGVDCTDPKGTGELQSYSHTPMSREPVGVPILPVSPNAGIQTSVGDAYLVWQDTFRKSLGLDSYGRKIKREKPNAFKVPTSEDVCDCDIVEKKTLIKIELPASIFSGKTRMFVQAQYGSKNKTIYGKGTFPNRMYFYKGLDGDENWGPESEKANRVAALDKGMTKLATDTQGNYYLLQMRNGVIINLLQPSKEGRMLQKWMRTQSLSIAKRNTYEAYILASCSPTRNIVLETDLKAYTKGADVGGYGWKSDWDGRELSVVTIDWDSPNKSYLYTAFIIFQMESVFEEEKIRKETSLKDQWEKSLAKLKMQDAPGDTQEQKEKKAQDRAALTPSIKFVYTCSEATFIHQYNDPDIVDTGDSAVDIITKICANGDIEEGAWWWVIQDSENATPEEMETLKKDLKTKNRVDGGLPHSKEFYEAMKGAISVSDNLMDSGTFKFRYKYDRVFTWDSTYNCYNLELSYSPKTDLEGVTGGGPIYCFYDQYNHLKVIRYDCETNIAPDERKEDAGDQSSCGDRQFSSSTNSKDVSTSGSFSVDSVSLSGNSADLTSYSNSNYQTQGCGGGEDCGNEPPYAHPGPCNLVTCGNWKIVSVRGGSITSEFESFQGGHYTRIACVIPKTESEAVYLAKGDIYVGSYTSMKYNAGNCVCKRKWTPRREMKWWSCFTKPVCCGNCCPGEPGPPCCKVNGDPGCGSMGVQDESGNTPALSIFGWSSSCTVSRRPAKTGGCPGEDETIVPVPIQGCDEAPVTSVTNPSYEHREGVVMLVHKTGSKEVLSGTTKVPGMNEWLDDRMFLGYIRPDFPWVSSMVDVKQSALGVWRCNCPVTVFGDPYPFDKKGLFYIGAS